MLAIFISPFHQITILGFAHTVRLDGYMDWAQLISMQRAYGNDNF